MRKTFLIDVGERTAATYMQAVCGLLLADSMHILSLGTVRAAAVAALPAALAVIKGALGGSVLGGSAAWLPPTPSAPAADYARGFFQNAVVPPAPATPPAAGAPPAQSGQ